MISHSRGGVEVAIGNMKTANGGMAKVAEGQENIIGDVVEVKFLNFNTSTLKGKVDTGATISSLDAHNLQIDQESKQVAFECQHLSQNRITLPLAQQQAVSSSDGGTEYRPVVALNVKVGDKLLQNAMFNLNNRSKMEYPVLIGQNILEKGGFLIDPRLKKDTMEDYDPQTVDVDWETLQEEFKDVEPENIEQNDTIKQLHKALSERVMKALELDGVMDITPDK